MPIAKRSFVSAFEWDARSARYRRRSTGRYAGRDEIQRALEVALGQAQREIRATSLALQAGRISVAEWRESMAAQIKATHLYSAALPRGGWAQLTAADFGRVGQMVREQYAFLNRFATQLGDGLALDRRFLIRAEMYGEASLTMFHESERVAMLETGRDEERNVLGVADHCDGCLHETSLGYVPIGVLTPIGRRRCRTRCRCRIRYRKRPA